MRIAQQLAAEYDGIGAAFSNHCCGLLHLGDKADRRRRDPRRLLDPLREWYLIAGLHGDDDPGHEPPCRHIEDVRPGVASSARDDSGRLDLPAAVGPVSGRDAHKERGVADRLANDTDNLEQEPRPVRERPAVIILALVG